MPAIVGAISVVCVTPQSLGRARSELDQGHKVSTVEGEVLNGPVRDQCSKGGAVGLDSWGLALHFNVFADGTNLHGCILANFVTRGEREFPDHEGFESLGLYL